MSDLQVEQQPEQHHAPQQTGDASDAKPVIERKVLGIFFFFD